MTARCTEAFTSTGPRIPPTSADALFARSMPRVVIGRKRDNPTASVSSVNGVGAKIPAPAEMRAVQTRPGWNSAETLGLR